MLFLWKELRELGESERERKYGKMGKINLLSGARFVGVFWWTYIGIGKKWNLKGFWEIPKNLACKLTFTRGTPVYEGGDFSKTSEDGSFL